MRKPIIAGNWKMNNTGAEGVKLVNELMPLVADATCDVVVCVPFTALEKVGEALKGSNVKLGAQNVHFAQNGAYTGEISAEMLVELGVEYVVIGHSERRTYFGETDETANLRVKTALSANLKPILCVGETLYERENDETEITLSRQVLAGLKDIEDLSKVIIAYEPVWAIGTGKTATKEQANETIGFIRKTIADNFSATLAKEVIIQYGGSMNAKNASELMAMEEIDGGLIGGASLKAEDFAKVVKF